MKKYKLSNYIGAILTNVLNYQIVLILTTGEKSIHRGEYDTIIESDGSSFEGGGGGGVYHREPLHRWVLDSC